MNETFTYKSAYGDYEDCYFQVGKYINGNIAIEVWNPTDGPITKLTVNPDIPLPSDRIAIKNYAENEGALDWLISMEIVKPEKLQEIHSGWITIPVHELTEKGKKMLGIY